MTRDFVPHVITARTIDGACYFIGGQTYGDHLGHARVMTKDDAERRVGALQRLERASAETRRANDPHEDDFSGVYGLAVVATTWEALDKAAEAVKTWEEADLAAEEAHDALYDDYDPNEGMSAEEIAAESAWWREQMAKDQPFAPGQSVTITDELHPDHGASARVVEAEQSGYLVLALGERLTWGLAKGVAAA
ncbi:hypothetical protein CcrC1_gp526 [Caulobacter phage C1]|nr:hypothetical protein CcrC1_gp033 [Caulobacter phage C1]UTU08260.1 hypothetical protein CcrC2_gp032 [Caulobacter phage C2]UTU08783.1 hypothetical protein CcrJ4_gp032 [Caulobacter phage J4]UTU09895.1 hypothetical protein CcrRB23_gp033 [Caulobacter phage RB23]WGN96919.1 hypothetical protein [Bertelyvirus sp.]